MDESEPVVPILLLGDSDVGKSTLLSRLTLPSSQATKTKTKPLPLLRDSAQPFTFDLRTRHGPFRLEFYDTASPESYTLLRPRVIILCFSIADRASLRSVQQRWKVIVETHFNYDEAMPVMLLGLKRDLRREGDAGVVWAQEAVNVAQEMRCDRYAECSAATGELCALVWEDVVGMAIGTGREGGGKSAAEYCVLM